MYIKASSSTTNSKFLFNQIKIIYLLLVIFVERFKDQNSMFNIRHKIILIEYYFKKYNF